MTPPAQLIVLLIATVVFFQLVVHLRRRGLAGALFATLLTVDLVLALLTLYLQPTYGLMFWSASALFGVLIIVPALLGMLARRMVSRGRWGPALRLLGLRRMLQPGAGREREVRVVEALALASAGRLDAAIERAEAALDDAGGARERAEAFDHLSGLYLMSRRFDRVVQRAEALGGVEAASMTPNVGIAMMRSYAEVGEMEKAAHCQSMLEGTQAASDPMHAQAMNAGRVAFLAHFGFRTHLEKLFEARSAFLPVSFEAHQQLWLGLAAARSGDPESALALWQKAAAQQDDPAAARVAAARIELDLDGRVEPTEALQELADLACKRATAYGQLPSGRGELRRVAPVTLALLGSIVLAHVLVMIAGINEDGLELLRYGANFRQLVHGGEWWRLLTSAWLHGPLMHIGFNALALYSLGRLVEQLFGSLRFFSVYVIAGAVGSWASVRFGPTPHLSIGASGAIFGLVGAALVGMYLLRGRIPDGWRKHLTVNLLLIIGLQVWIGYSIKFIDNAAHYGGLVGGAVAALLVGIKRRDGAEDSRGRRGMLWAVAALCAAALVASGVMLARTPIETSLARIPAKTVRRAKLSVAAPAHWTVVPDGGPLALRDPLVGLVRPVALLVETPNRIDDSVTLADYARRSLEIAAEHWRHVKQVSAVEVKSGSPIKAANVVSGRVYYRFSGFNYVRVHIYKKQRDLVIRARVNLRAEHISAYRGMLERVARSLRFDDR